MNSPADTVYSPEILLWGDSITEGKPGASYAVRLETLLPAFRFINHGRGGDTVGSLLNRLEAVPLPDTPAPLALLWVGVNDVYADISPVYGLWKTAMRQVPTRDREKFCRAFRAVLGLLGMHADRILVLPPLFVGEDPATELNRRLEDMSECIAGITGEYTVTRYLDIRARLPLPGTGPSSFLPVNPWPKLADTVADTVAGTEDDYFDRAAERRGLMWTYDGVHLNSRGADETAATIADTITEILEAAG